MASIDEAALMGKLKELHDEILVKVDTKIYALEQAFGVKLNTTEIDYNTKIDGAKQEATAEVTDLKALTKKAYDQQEDAVSNLDQSISSLEVRLKESMGSKVFTEKSIQFADIVDKALIQQKQSTDTLKEDAQTEFLKYQYKLKDIKKELEKNSINIRKRLRKYTRRQ